MNKSFFDIEIKNNRAFKVLLHLMVWVMLFTMPYLLSSRQSYNILMLVERSWIPLLFYAILFYLNYLFLIDRFFFQRKIFWYAIINAAVFVMLIGLSQLLKSQFFMHVGFQKPPGHAPPVNFFIYIDILSMFVPLVFSIALKISERWIKIEAERKESANAKLQSELQHLKYQLQPHFFFNSLNNIYSLVDISPTQAKETIHSLGKLMRYLLYDTNAGLVSLAGEVDFMKKYIDLMKLRTSGKTSVHTCFSEVKPEIMVAPLLFISLIENAFKHGVFASSPSDIYFNLQVDEDKVCFLTRNKKNPKAESDLSGPGIGLKNLSKRLSLLYPDNHTFTTEIVDGDFVASLTIRYRHIPNQI